MTTMEYLANGMQQDLQRISNDFSAWQNQQIAQSQLALEAQQQVQQNQVLINALTR